MEKILIFLSFFLLANCKNLSSNIFIGKWQILNVVENGKSAKLVDNWIELKKDGTFISYDGRSRKKEKGKWVYNEIDHVLFIDDTSVKNEDSEWFLSIKADTLIFKEKKGELYLISKRIN